MLLIYLSFIVVFALIAVFMGRTALAVVAGLSCVFCAVMNYEWFMGHHRAAPIVAIFGRNGARVFYIILGLAIVILSLIYKV